MKESRSNPYKKSRRKQAWMDISQRKALGQACLKKVPLISHAIWKPSPKRADPVSLLCAFDTTKIANLLPIKYGRMLESAFAYYRGSVSTMAADLADSPSTKIPVQLCGDAHAKNLGAFATSAGDLVFDLNDFDETIPGPWEWDLKRLATSLVLGAENCLISKTMETRKKAICRKAVLRAVYQYRHAMTKFSKLAVLDLHRQRLRPKRSVKKSIETLFSKAARTTPRMTLQKLTVKGDAKLPTFRNNPPILHPISKKEKSAVIDSLKTYRNTLGASRQLILDAYTPFDVAFKVVGIGSVGTYDYIVLLFGRDEKDVLFIQIKEERPCSYTPFLQKPPVIKHQGERVAKGQLRLQTEADPFVGWTNINGRDYLVRQLCDHKATVELNTLSDEEYIGYGELCAQALARAHARTGDAIAIAEYIGRSDELDKAITEFALTYAEQVQADYKLFKKAIKSGRLKADKSGQNSK